MSNLQEDMELVATLGNKPMASTNKEKTALQSMCTTFSLVTEVNH